MGHEEYEPASELFRILSAPLRLAIIDRLTAGPAPVHALVAASGESQPLISQHLRVLRAAKLIRVQTNGRERVYSLTDAHVAHIVTDAMRHTSEPGPANSRLPMPDDFAPPGWSAFGGSDGNRKDMTMADGFLSVSRRIEAPAEQLFALLADSANHPLIDGSGMVREPAPAVKVSGTGDVFMINMYNDHDGNYQVRNVVVEYLADRRLVWAPMTPTSDPQEQHAVDPVRYEWGYELAPDGPGATVVTETFDCRRAPEDLRKRLREGETWRDSMTASLVKLELLAKTRGQQ